MKFLRIILILLALSATCILPLGCGSDASSTQQTYTVQRGNITTEITSVGNLEYSKTVDLTFEIDCTVSEVLVEAGDSVKQGQVLCRFDESIWEGEINTLMNQAAAARYSLTTAQLGVIKAEQNLALAQQGIITANNTIISLQIAVLQAQINLDNAETTLEQLKNSSSDPVEIQIAELRVELARGELNIAEMNLNIAIIYNMQMALAAVDDATAALDNAQKAVIDAQKKLDVANQTLSDAQNAGPQVTAPIDGLITDAYVTSDQEVKSGDTAFVIADPTKFEATIMVSEQNISKVELGAQATVEIEALNGVSIPATVSFVSPKATIQSSVVNYEVHVELTSLSSITSNQTPVNSFPSSGNTSADRPPFGEFGQLPASDNLTQEQINEIQQQQQSIKTSLADVQLTQGMTATISIITAQATNVLLVPTQAISIQGTQTTIQVLVNGIVETRQVVTGISNSSYTEITSGLSEGDQVLVSQSSSSSSTSSSSNTVPTFSPGNNMEPPTGTGEQGGNLFGG
jgi:multidrug efflux pump subunit AcrA (membrane-fusion protein)